MTPKVKDRYFIMPIQAGRGAQGDLHQPHNPNQGAGGANGGDNNGGRLLNPDTFQPSSAVAKNLYIDARWGAEKVGPNDPVGIIAQLSAALNEVVTINIFHALSDTEEVLLATLRPELKNGRVETVWKAQNPNKNAGRGNYFFVIFGGMAFSKSHNRLVIG